MYDIFPLLSYKDALLAPLYFILLLRIVILWKRKYYTNLPIGRYLVPFFLLKIFCCIALALLYHFYFGSGDANLYYTGAKEIYNATKANPSYGVELLFKPFQECSQEAQQFTQQLDLDLLGATSTIVTAKIAGFIAIFCFGTYLPIAFIFTFLGMIGAWKIFLIFNEEYPQHSKLLAMSCLFVPSALIWATNVLKDPICLFGLALCFTAMYRFIKRRFRLVNLIGLLTGSLILFVLKDYIFYIFMMAATVTIYSTYVKNIKNGFIKFCTYVLLFLVFLGVFRAAIHNENFINDFVINNFVDHTRSIQTDQLAVDDGTSSSYSISSASNFSPVGILSSYLSSLNVTLFRPYLWEAKKPLVALNALESLVIFLLTLYLFFKAGIRKFFTFSGTNPLLLFALLFTLLLAPLVGFVSFNFGTLCRYKLPIVPMFYTYLVLLYASVKNKKEARLALLHQG